MSLTEATVLLIGAGETSQLVAKYLKNEHIKQFIVANRTQRNTDKLSEFLDAENIGIANIQNTSRKQISLFQQPPAHGLLSGKVW